jgi:hypothetical protein
MEFAMKLASIAAFLFSVMANAQTPPLEPPYTKAPTTSSSTKPIERPEEVDKDTGDYFYKPKKESAAIRYKIDPRPATKKAAFLRFGTVGPYDLASDNSNYKDVYTDSSSFVIYAEYERVLGHLMGNWSVKFGTGVTTESGSGQFLVPDSQGRLPREKYNLFVLPNTVLMSYKLRFSDNQWVVPYVEGGGGYFTFVEYRNDGDSTSYGGAFVTAVTGGLLLNLNLLDDITAGSLYEDYGIANMWLDLQFRQNIGLDDKKDFTSNMIIGGFGFAF